MCRKKTTHAHETSDTSRRTLVQVIYPFIDKDTKEKFVFVSGSAQSAASQAILSKTFDTDELEEVRRFSDI